MLRFTPLGNKDVHNIVFYALDLIMFLIAFLCSVSALRIHKNFFIQDLERSVDLTTALVKSTSKVIDYFN